MTPFYTLCHIGQLKLPAAPDVGPHGPKGFKTDRPIPLRQPGTHENGSALDPTTPTLTLQPLTYGATDKALSAVHSYPG